MDDTKQTVHQFLDLISSAQLSEEEWVETTKEIMMHYNRKGLGTNPLTGKENRYFLFNGIKVCEIGQKESIEAEMNEAQGNRVHGPKEAVVISGAGV